MPSFSVRQALSVKQEREAQQEIQLLPNFPLRSAFDYRKFDPTTCCSYPMARLGVLFYGKIALCSSLLALRAPLRTDLVTWPWRQSSSKPTASSYFTTNQSIKVRVLIWYQDGNPLVIVDTPSFCSSAKYSLCAGREDLYRKFVLEQIFPYGVLSIAIKRALSWPYLN